MKKLLLALVFSTFATYANAASCFWVGGAGTWSTANTASWASGTGGTGGTCAATGGIPKQAADTATFDALSGAGTVTVDATLNGATLTQLTYSAASVSLDFSANNPSLTLTGGTAIAISGAGQTFNCGTGTLTLTGSNNSVWSFAGTSTLTCTSGTIALTFTGAIGGTQSFTGGGKTYGTVTFSGRNTATQISIAGANTFTTLNITGPAIVNFPGAATTTITNAFNWTGTSAAVLSLRGGASGQLATIHASATSTIAWAYLSGLTFNTSSVTAANSFDGQSNSGVTITPPNIVAGGGSRCIGC